MKGPLFLPGNRVLKGPLPPRRVRGDNGAAGSPDLGAAGNELLGAEGGRAVISQALFWGPRGEARGEALRALPF